MKLKLVEAKTTQSSHYSEIEEPTAPFQRPRTCHRSYSNSELICKMPPQILTENFVKGSPRAKNPATPTEFRIKSNGFKEFGNKLIPNPEPARNVGSSREESASELPRIIVTSVDNKESEIRANRRTKTASAFILKKQLAMDRSEKRFDNLKPVKVHSDGIHPVSTVSQLDLKSHNEVEISPSIPSKSGSLSMNPSLVHIPEATEGRVKAFGADTNNGIVRKFNEDKVSIILNIIKPAHLSNETWPQCSFFGVYDGHRGDDCADFLKENLYKYIIREPAFPSNPREALLKGFQAAESKFLEISQNTKLEKCGSCALVVLVVGDICYVANVGDSRAIMSGDKGNKIFPLTRDHRPGDPQEQKRIIEAGGKVYQSQIGMRGPENSSETNKAPVKLGPIRVFPGRLSVSRTIGDAYAKLPQSGGNPNVIISEPEIRAFKIHSSYDFIVVGTDGVFEKMTSRECVEAAWKGINSLDDKQKGNEKCAAGAEFVLKEAMDRKSLDNVTAVIISFSDLAASHSENSLSQGQREESQFSGIESPMFPKRRFSVLSIRTTSDLSSESLQQEENSVMSNEKVRTPSKNLLGMCSTPSMFNLQARITRRNFSVGPGEKRSYH